MRINRRSVGALRPRRTAVLLLALLGLLAMHGFTVTTTGAAAHRPPPTAAVLAQPHAGAASAGPAAADAPAVTAPDLDRHSAVLAGCLAVAAGLAVLAASRSSRSVPGPRGREGSTRVPLLHRERRVPSLPPPRDLLCVLRV